MRLVLLDDNYPSPDNVYADVFAHVRAKGYAQVHDVVVLSSFSKPGPSYEYEGIEVRRCGSMSAIRNALDELAPDAVLVHFATIPVIREVLLSCPFPVVIWVHGFEVTGWFRRLYDFRTPVHFLRYIKGNIIQRRAFGRLIRHANRTDNVYFVFVSEWIRRVAASDCGGWPRNSAVISNPIDDRLFDYRAKCPDDRRRVLILRPFTGKKYATDLMTEAMSELDRRGLLDRFTFEIHGEGASQSAMARRFAGRSNVQINEGFLVQEDIPKLHARNGVALMISRQDTHGVSACEAMASGLVPVSSHVSAIPEYMTHRISALLTDNSPTMIADSLLELSESPELFARLSRAAAVEARKKSAIDDVLARELEIIDSVVTAAARV